jgi:hypothetical protein
VSPPDLNARTDGPAGAARGPRPLLTFGACGAFAVAVALNFFYLQRYAVDIPYYDDWELYLDLYDGLSVAELLAPHNEHRIVLTRLQNLLLLHLTGWNMVVQQWLNLAVYVGGVVGFTRFLQRRAGGGLAPWAVAAFTLLLLSPRPYENHLWAFQSQFHFGWILPLAAVALLFREPLGRRHAAGAGACLALASWSFAGGAIASLVVTLVFLAHQAWRASSRTAPRARRAAAAHAALAAVPALTAVGLWLVLLERPANHPAPATPASGEFWVFFFNLVSLGFGIDTVSALLGLGCLLVATAPLALLFARRAARDAPASWALAACTLAVLAVLAGVATGRAPMGLGESKASRFTEFAGLLAPLVAAAWALAIDAGRPRPRDPRRARLALSALWLGCAVAQADNWSFARCYEPTARSRKAGLACAEAYYFDGGDGICVDVWWPQESMGYLLETARELELSLYRKMCARRGVPPPRERPPPAG